jgi:CxxC-x17-CxxC domain-containing protein
MLLLVLLDRFKRITYLTVLTGVRTKMQDKTLTCSDCGQQFTFTASEQEFFAQKGFNDPSRCPDCRAARKAARDSGGSYGGSSRSGGERQMYPAVCAQCGKQTEVPFQPRGDRPVYCSDCFRAQQGGSSSGGYGGGRSSSGSRGGGRSGGSSRW